MTLAVEKTVLSVVQIEPVSRGLPRYQVMSRIAQLATNSNVVEALELLVAYAGASHYLLAREDQLKEAGLNFIISSNWPFDLVKRISTEMAASQSRISEMDKCLTLLRPRMAVLPDDVTVPLGIDRQYCAMMFCAGRVRYMMMVMFEHNALPSDEKLREVAMLASYFASSGIEDDAKDMRDIDLTERELECLYWIAEGKTSDEMATILGISRNTINNYITSIMRKTATKTRSEAIAFAVRNNLV